MEEFGDVIMAAAAEKERKIKAATRQSSGGKEQN